MAPCRLLFWLAVLLVVGYGGLLLGIVYVYVLDHGCGFDGGRAGVRRVGCPFVLLL